MRRSSVLRVALLATLTVGTLFNTGCQQIVQLIQAIAGGGLSGGGGGFNPGSLIGGGGGGVLPPGLGGAGNSPPLAPNSLLPAPPQSQATVQQIQQQYGVRIGGRAAVSPYLDIVKDGLLHYPTEKVQGLGTINMQLIQGTQGVLGDWSVSGGPAHINFYVQTGRRKPLWNNTVVHELGHHSTLYHSQFGGQLRQALGNHPGLYPSGYARSSRAELLAETMAFSLLGNRGDETPLPSWRLTQPAKQLIETEIVAKRPKV